MLGKNYPLAFLFQLTGYRVGKGEGYADIEYAMMVTMGAINHNTVVITTVHDCQIVDIPDELTDDHDLMVNQNLSTNVH